MIRQMVLTLLCLIVCCFTACEKLATMRAHHYFNNAKKLYEAGDYRNALEECDNALTFDPNFIDAVYLKGMIYYRTASYKSSIEWLRKAVLQKTDDQELRRALIDALLKAERYPGAINNIKILLDQNPTDPELLFMYYYAHIRSRDDNLIGKAQEKLTELVNQNYEDPRIYCLVAELAILKGDHAQAQELLKRFYTPHEIWENTMILLADSFARAGDYNKVLEIYDDAIQKSNKKRMLQDRLTKILLLNRQYKLTVQFLSPLYAQYPNDREILFNLITCFASLKKFEEAQHIIDTALKAYPDDLDLKRKKIEILIYENKLDDAMSITMATMSSCPQKSPEYIEFKNKVAEIYFLRGKFDEAKAQAQEIFMLSPKDIQARFLLCKIELQESANISVVGELRQLINENPNNAEYYYYLGLAHRKRKENVMAEKAFREALQKNPGHQGALIALAKIYYPQGSFNILEKDIQEYFKIYPEDNETMQLLNKIKTGQAATD